MAERFTFSFDPEPDPNHFGVYRRQLSGSQAHESVMAPDARHGNRYIALLHLLSGDGIPQSVEYWSDFAFIIAGVALVPALLRCTFIFTPPKWGHWIWVVSATSTIAFLLLSHLLPPH
jgi:hypothetical protein